MGKAYTQVTMEERCEIARLRSQGSSLRQIAAGVDRPPSTVARELKRNGSRTLGYQPRYANQQAHARRWRGSRLERHGPLREQVLAGLGAGWSPAQVAGRLALDEGRRIISHESIYRFIYAQMARKKDYSWRHYLPRAKAKRGFRGRRGGSPATHIAHRVPLSQRPHAADRATFGDWELDPTGQPTQNIIESRRGAEFITPLPKPRQRGRTRGGRQQQLVFDEARSGRISGPQALPHRRPTSNVRPGGGPAPAPSAVAACRQALSQQHDGVPPLPLPGRRRQDLPPPQILDSHLPLFQRPVYLPHSHHQPLPDNTAS